ncbi:hypothetical protein IW147_006056 [Coemansia sp. RSA 720]|nr:hypothetical protein IW147_006056 [Coemansia sp. RSA 720]
MSDISTIFEHRKYKLTHYQQSDSSRSTPSRQPSGFLSSSSISLVSSPVSPNPSSTTSPRTKRTSKLDLWSSPTKNGRQIPTNRKAPDTELDIVLTSLAKARKLVPRDPAVAATVLWKIAKDLTVHSQQLTNMRAAIETTQECLHRMVDRPELRGAKGSAAVWSARSLLKTTLECDLVAARLLWPSDKQAAAAQYVRALCRYMGIEPRVISELAATHEIREMSARAAGIAKEIPRKFAKSEDVLQALDALEETASAQLASVASEPSILGAKRGLAVFLLQHAFATDKQSPDTAYQTVLTATTSLRALNLQYLANDCVTLIIDHHMSQPDARIQVARAVTSSLTESDFIRARELLQTYNYRFEEPWSRFMANVVDKAINADIRWMSERAMNEWQSIVRDSLQNNCQVYELVQATLTAYLEPYTWYVPKKLLDC